MQNSGQLRVHTRGLLWKKQGGGKVVEVDKASIVKITWMKVPRSNQLDVQIKDGLKYNFFLASWTSSNKLKRLCLSNCYNITSSGLSNAVKKLPQLEKLHLYYTSITVEDIELIGQNCPRLNSFKLNKEFSRRHIEFDGDAFAIANSMPELRHLQLFGNKMTNEGLQAILHGCVHL